MTEPAQEDFAEAGKLLKPVFAAFKREAAVALADEREKMRKALRVRYDAEPARTPAGVPAPRLQLRWVDDDPEYMAVCLYELVFPLRDLDVRNDAKTGFAVVELGRTGLSGGGSMPWKCEDARMGMPYRDGAHAAWDAKVFGGLPVYVVAPDGTARLVPPREE